MSDTTAKQWLACDLGDEVHVIPVDDLVDHLVDECPCGPTTEAVEREDGSMGWAVTHHALDGREHSEPDHDRASCPGCSVA